MSLTVRSYSFGRFSVALENYSSSFLLEKWKHYQAEESVINDTLRIEYHSDPLQCIHTLENGWFGQVSGITKQATYFQNSSPAFQFKYGNKPSTIHLYAKQSDLHSIKIGTQFAVMIGLANQCIGLHAVTMICGNQVILLSAPSGTGKTTLAHLLSKYCRSVIVNGDFALLSIDAKSGVIFEPTPFCGSSGKCHNYRLGVDRIVFLDQATDNHWQSLNTRQALTYIMSNSFIPNWDPELYTQFMNTILQIVEIAPIDYFAFTPNQSAAEMLHGIVTNVK